MIEPKLLAYCSRIHRTVCLHQNQPAGAREPWLPAAAVSTSVKEFQQLPAQSLVAKNLRQPKNRLLGRRDPPADIRTLFNQLLQFVFCYLNDLPHVRIDQRTRFFSHNSASLPPILVEDCASRDTLGFGRLIASELIKYMQQLHM